MLALTKWELLPPWSFKYKHDHKYMRENVHPNQYPICGCGQQNVKERAEQAQRDNSDEYPRMLHKHGAQGSLMWLLGDCHLCGFLLVGGVVIVLFVVIKGIWIILADSREEANKMELRRLLTCFKSSLRLTNLMLFMTFCCSSAVASTWVFTAPFCLGLCCGCFWTMSVSASS